MSARHFLAALALVPTLALPATAQAHAHTHATTGTAHTPGVPPSKPQQARFDLQAHRGGLGMTTESTLEGFAKALRLGVSTLELDTQITRDHKVVVTHDRQVSAQKCRDTAPVTPGDPQYPYVGRYIKDLTLAQIRTMDCGYQQLPGHPEQERIAGARMVELRDVLSLVRRSKARQVTLNVETKVEAGAPEQTAPRELFVRRVFEEIRASGIEDQVTIQSFDWGALKAMHRLAPDWPLVALTNHDFLQVGKPGASPWLGGIDADDYGGDFVRAAATIPGVRALSPNYGFPQNGKIGDPGFRFYPDRTMIADAHARGLKVIPWTCDDPATVAALMDLGVDGVITNYPDRVRALMAERGMRLPKPYHPRGLRQ
jgi:glycerophosphoryl diester phosphodiesterase